MVDLDLLLLLQIVLLIVIIFLVTILPLTLLHHLFAGRHAKVAVIRVMFQIFLKVRSRLGSCVVFATQVVGLIILSTLVHHLSRIIPGPSSFAITESLERHLASVLEFLVLLVTVLLLIVVLLNRFHFLLYGLIVILPGFSPFPIMPMELVLIWVLEALVRHVFAHCRLVVFLVGPDAAVAILSSASGAWSPSGLRCFILINPQESQSLGCAPRAKECLSPGLLGSNSMINQRQEGHHFTLKVPLVLPLLSPPVYLGHIEASYGNSRSHCLFNNFFLWFGSDIDREHQTLMAKRFQRFLLNDKFGLTLDTFVMIGPLKCLIIVFSDFMFPK